MYTFGYRTGFILKQYKIAQIAELLRTHVINKLKTKDLYFVAHSLGGIVTQKMLIHLIDKGDTELFNRIKRIIYLAVPFEGAKGGTLVSAVGSLVPPILYLILFNSTYDIIFSK
jgi:triacylglycerol esterase/lipase EstA (alpha/beta hydrolase family)